MTWACNPHTMATKHGKKYRVSYREDGKVKTAYFPSEEEADLFRVQRKHDKKFRPERLGVMTANDKTFAHAVKAYYSSKAQDGDIEKTTVKSDVYRLNEVILPAVGDIPIRKFSEADIDKVVSTYRIVAKKEKRDEQGRIVKLSRTITNSTINRALDIVRAVLRYAGRRDIEVKKLPKDNAVIRPPSRAEAQAIIAEAADHVKRAVYLACATGIRPGQKELFALTWGDVDFDTMEIFVESARKGGLDSRNVPIADYLRPLLLAWHKEDGGDISKTIIAYKGKSIGSIKKAWAAALRRAKITRRIRPYDMRHHFATNTLGRGADLKSVSNMMGHSDPNTTVRIYQHVLAGAKVEAVNKLPDLTAEIEDKKKSSNDLQTDLHNPDILQ